MNPLQRYQRTMFRLCLITIFILIIANIATAAIRDDDPPPVRNSLPDVCLLNSVVIPCPIPGDMNGDGKLNAGDILLLQRKVLNQ